MGRIVKSTLILLLFISSYSFAQTGVKVTYYDGSVQVFNITATGKLSFATDNLLVKLTETATTTTIPVGIIRKINFTDSLAQSPLGVDLTSFKVSAGSCSATVNWESGNEENFSYYELQYGINSSSFSNFLKVYGKGSNNKYSASLPDVKGKFYYRLKMVDKDGTTKYSSIISNQILCSESVYAIYPNPGADMIKIISGASGNLNVKIFTSTGQLVKRGIYQPGEGIQVSGLKSGLYLVQVNGLTIKFTKK